MIEIGTVTGIVGMVTGVAGSLMGYLGYRQSIANKVLDLRLQLRREVNALKAIVEPLPSSIELAVQSRARVLAATGSSLSGNQLIFEQSADTDKATISGLAPLVAALDRDYFSQTHRELELMLSEVNRLTLQASRLVEKYRVSMAEDEALRLQIRSEHATLAAARTQIPLKKKLGE